jgi:hypothetical protein
MELLLLRLREINAPVPGSDYGITSCLPKLTPLHPTR